MPFVGVRILKLALIFLVGVALGAFAAGQPRDDTPPAWARACFDPPARWGPLTIRPSLGFEGDATGGNAILLPAISNDPLPIACDPTFCGDAGLWLVPPKSIGPYIITDQTETR